MELLESQIEAFVSTDVGFGYGYGDGFGDGNGNGDGDGFGDGDGYGNGYGNGDGDGYGNGYGSGFGDGYVYGNGNGYVYGNGNGDGSGDGIAEIEGYKVHTIDHVNSVIMSIRSNVAQGYIIEKNTHLVPCFIVKENNSFAHGKTLHEAYAALQEKLYDNSTEEERIAAFVKKFPDYNTSYDNADLFAYHHVLTGSCRMGRESFVKSHGLSLDGTTTVKEFINLTKDSYGGEIIKQLKEEYK